MRMAQSWLSDSQIVVKKKSIIFFQEDHKVFKTGMMTI